MGSMIEKVLPKDIPEKDADFMEFYSQFNTSMMPIAFVLSYYRNKSYKWALIHTLFGAPYVAYVLTEIVSSGSSDESK